MERIGNNPVLQYSLDESKSTQPVVCAGCSDITICSAADVQATAGRILEVQVHVRNVCPGKRTALAVSVHELDGNDNEQMRGRKIMTLPAHRERSCRDFLVRGLQFLLPEDISLAESCDVETGCTNRRFVVRSAVHYIDACAGTEE